MSVTPKIELSVTPRMDLSDAASSSTHCTGGEHLTEQPSFNALLQTYGAPTPLHGSGSRQTEIDASHVPGRNEVCSFDVHPKYVSALLSLASSNLCKNLR